MSKAQNIISLKISCVDGRFLEEEVSKLCEVESAYKLQDLCCFILESFEFDSDHPHNFFISRSPRSGRGYEIDEERMIESIFPLTDNKCLYMRFDYGDEWIFKIARTNKKVAFDSKVTYPRVVGHFGNNPVQYPSCEKE